MDQSRRDTINEWSLAEDRIGPIPHLNNYEILKDISRCFTSKDNPAGTSKSNVQFQCDLNTMIQGDNEYFPSPTLARLCEMVVRIMHQWEAVTAENNRMSGHVPSEISSTTSRTKTAKSREDTSTSAGGASAATTMNSSVYDGVVFDLTLFNEVTRTDHVIYNIKAIVIDSCIEVIVGLPDIRSHRLIHLIPSYFDTPDPTYLEPQSTSKGNNPRVPRDSATLSLLAPAIRSTKNTAARSRGSVPCDKCSASSHPLFSSRTLSNE